MIQHRTSRVKFVRAACKNCKFDQVLFMCATTKVKCFNCGEIIAIPKGGKCELVGANITEKLR